MLTHEDRVQISKGIHQKYAKVAASPQGKFQYPVGRAGLEAQGYPEALLAVLPEQVLAAYCGVGNPFSLGPIQERESILDIGCGAGVDVLMAGLLAGPQGRVVGIDFVLQMLQRAKANLSQTTLGNVMFEQASAENLPFAGASFDVVTSNGVFNLVPDKLRALREVLRVLQPGGRLMMADQVLIGKPPQDTKSLVESWAG